MKVREESNEIQDLSTRTFGFSEGKESKCRREVSEVPLDVWREAGYLEIIYSKLLEVRECRKVTQGAYAKPVGAKFFGGIPQADPESLDEWKKTEIVRFFEWVRPPILLVPRENCPVIRREGVVKMGDGGDVPQVAGHGACPEGAGVVNEVGDNRIYKFLWEPSDR